MKNKNSKRAIHRRNNRSIKEGNVLMTQLLNKLTTHVERFGEQDESVIEAFNTLEMQWKYFCKKVHASPRQYGLFAANSLIILKNTANGNTEEEGGIISEQPDKEDQQPEDGPGKEVEAEDHQKGTGQTI